MNLQDYYFLKEFGKSYWWFKGKRKLVSSFLSKISDIKKKELKILNIGCGTGEDIKEYSKYGEVISIDNDKKSIESLPPYLKKELMDAENLKFKDNSFDIILVLDVLEHIKNDQLVIKEIKRALKKDGYAICTVPALPFLFGPMDIYEGHFRRYSYNQLKKTFKNFKICRISYWNFILFPQILCLKLFKKMFAGRKVTTDFKKLPKIINNIFYNLIKIEINLINSKINLPIGSSLIILAKK